MIKIKFTTRVFLFLLFFITAGCAVNLNTNHYILSGVSIRQWQSCSCGLTLLVAEPTAQEGYDNDQIVYMECPYQLKAYSQNRWVAPPHEMLKPLISQTLRNTGYFKAVANAPFVGETHYILQTRLLKLQHEFFCLPSSVHMTLQAILTDTSCHVIIAEKIFDVSVIAPKNNPYGGVLAANKATKITLNKLANFVIGAIQHHPCIPLPVKIKVLGIETS